MATLQEVMEAVSELSPGERQSLRVALEAWPDEAEATNGSSNGAATHGAMEATEAEREAAALQRMLERGLIERIASPTPADVTAYEAYQPVTVEGEPVSETIIRERR